MRIKLLFPPHFSVYQPYLSLPVLKAFLKEKGIFVSQEDLNLSSFYYFMRPKYLHKSADKLENIIKTYEKQKTLSESHKKHYDIAIKALLSAPLVVSNIKCALEFFHSKDDFIDFNEYILQERIIQKAMQIVSAVHYPTCISLTDFLTDYSPESSKEIFKAIENNGTNPYIKFFIDFVIHTLSVKKYDLVGISIISMSQVIPALTLAYIIKKYLPEVRIVIGGVIPNHLSQKMKGISKLFTLFDYIIKGEGETPLFKLCESIKGNIPICEVPNLIYLENGLILESRYRSFEEVDSLPTPDYDGYPLEKYLSPLPVLSVEPARGCYWRKCTFCNQYSIHGNRFHLRDPQLIIADIKRLQNKYGTKLFNISNEGVPANHLYRIAEVILETGLDIQWYAGAQIKKSFSMKICHILRSAGCRKLIFGLESGSQRILNIMKKGIALEDVPQVLQACTEADIDVHLYLMIGFPTETMKEIKATQNLVLKLLSNINKEGFTLYISVFQPMIKAPIINQLSQLGYEITPKCKTHDLSYIFEYHSNNGCVNRFSQEQLEEISANMSSKIYSHLPTQTIPQELTHYMCYRFGEYRASEKPTKHWGSQNFVWESLLNNRGFIEKNNWISLRKLKFVNNPVSVRWHKNTIAYNLLKDKYYLLNESAENFLNYFTSPKELKTYLKELGLKNDTNLKPYLKRFIIYLLKENLIELKEAEKHERS